MISFSSKGQSKESYLPIEIGKEINYKWVGQKSIHSFVDSIYIDNKIYYAYSKKTEINNIQTLIHIKNDTVYSYNDYLKKHEPRFGLIPIIGTKIGKGTVIKNNHSLKNRKGRIYDKLLVIEIKSSNGQIQTEYYKKGIGLIAMKMNKRFIIMIDE